MAIKTLNLGRVKGEKGASGVSMRLKGAWAASTPYVNNGSYIDFVTYNGNTYGCKTSHTSTSSFVESNWYLVAKKGDTGATGPQGATGSAGATGPQGATGPKGDTGAKGTSFRNLGAWAASKSYVNNAQYIDVVTNGGSTYMCASSHTSGTSFDASKWTVLAQKGNTGAQGVKGDTGQTGPQGPAGAAGATGPQGPAGATGATGAKGDKGDKGATGTSFRNQGTWAANKAYVNNGSYIDVVSYNGSSYMCLSGHTSTSTFDTTKWTLLASKGATGSPGATGPAGAAGATGPKGDTGATGTSLRLIGAWTTNKAYVNNTQYIDIVTNGGNTYACKTSHTSSTSFDSSKWTLLAQKGNTGATGAKGDKGETGAAGAAGAKGEKGDTGDVGPQGPSIPLQAAQPTGQKAGEYWYKLIDNAKKFFGLFRADSTSAYTQWFPQTKAAAVTCDDGKTAQDKVGAIKGLASSTASVTETGYAADAKDVKDQLAELNSKIGDYRYASKDNISINNTKEFDLVSLTLPAGVWVVSINVWNDKDRTCTVGITNYYGCTYTIRQITFSQVMSLSSESNVTLNYRCWDSDVSVVQMARIKAVRIK